MKRVSVSMIAVVASLFVSCAGAIQINDGSGSSRSQPFGSEFDGANFQGNFYYTQPSEAQNKYHEAQAKAAELDAQAKWYNLYKQMEKDNAAVRADERKSKFRKLIDRWVHCVNGVYVLGKGAVVFGSSMIASAFYSVAALPGFVSIGLNDALSLKLDPKKSFLLSGFVVNGINVLVNGASFRNSFANFVGGADQKFRTGQSCINLMKSYITSLQKRKKKRGYTLDVERSLKEEMSRSLKNEGAILEDKWTELADRKEELERRDEDLDAKEDKLSEAIKALSNEVTELFKNIGELGERRDVISEKITKLLEDKGKAHGKMKLSLKSGLKSGEQDDDDSGYDSDATLVDEDTKDIETTKSVSQDDDSGYDSGYESDEEAEVVAKGIVIRNQKRRLEERKSELANEREEIDESWATFFNERSNLRKARAMLRFRKLSHYVGSAASRVGFVVKNGLEDLVDVVGMVGAGLSSVANFTLSAAYYTGAVPAAVVSFAPGFWSPIINNMLKRLGVDKLKAFFITGGFVSVSSLLIPRQMGGAWSMLGYHLNNGITEGLSHLLTGVDVLDDNLFR